MENLTLLSIINPAQKYKLLAGQLNDLKGFDERVKEIFYFIDPNQKNQRHVCLIIYQNDSMFCELSERKDLFWPFWELKKEAKTLELIINFIVDYIFNNEINKKYFKHLAGLRNSRWHRELRDMQKQNQLANLKWLN